MKTYLRIALFAIGLIGLECLLMNQAKALDDFQANVLRNRIESHQYHETPDPNYNLWRSQIYTQQLWLNRCMGQAVLTGKDPNACQAQLNQLLDRIQKGYK